jgi:hypothetical protein
MTERDIQNAMNEYRRQLNEAVGQRDLLNVKILNLEQNIRNLRAALTETRLTAARQEDSLVGLTEAIRVVFRRNNEPMTSGEVRMSLKAMGVDLDRFANPSGTVTNTLKRMAEAGELKFSEGNKTYQMHRYADLYLSGMRGNEKPR